MCSDLIPTCCLEMSSGTLIFYKKIILRLLNHKRWDLSRFSSQRRTARSQQVDAGEETLVSESKGKKKNLSQLNFSLFMFSGSNYVTSSHVWLFRVLWVSKWDIM